MMAKPSNKGQDGEIRVALDIATLDRTQYHPVHNVTVLVGDGTTQIDHVVFSKYGIFVVETKNYTGWIFGKEREPKWTRASNGRSDNFQNPIRQNHRHIKSLSELLGLEEHLFHSVIAFCGDSEFKTPMPSYILDGGYADYIRSKKMALFSETEASTLAEKLKASMLERGEETNRMHVESLQQRHAKKEVLALADDAISRENARRKRAGSKRPRFWPAGRDRTTEGVGFRVPTKTPRRKNSHAHGKLGATLLLVVILFFAANSFYGGIKQLVSKRVPHPQVSAGLDTAYAGAGPSRVSGSSSPPAPAVIDASADPRAPIRTKEEAWEHWYSPAPECENQTEQNMVDCGNKYIRARQKFERLYVQGKVR
ncbi:MAG: nuclease-related domain-containing protein [Gallionellaceae bacterium]|nr:nuclease-related domain-containing protein [Gallionellaceae bacterium]